jgi:hypothetical protein
LRAGIAVDPDRGGELTRQTIPLTTSSANAAAPAPIAAPR